MKKAGSLATMTLGFAILIAVIVTITIVWYRYLYTTGDHLEMIVTEQNERQLIFTMRDAAYKRAISLFRMSFMEDPFDLDEEHQKFREMAVQFIIARDQLLSEEGLMGQELLLWEKARPFVIKGSRLQNRAAELIQEGRIDEAHELITTEVIPTQETVMEVLTEMLDFTGGNADKAAEQAFFENNSTLTLTTILSFVSILLGLLTARIVVKKTAAAEASTLERTQRIKALYDVSTLPGLTLDQEISEMLKRGCELLDCDSGWVNRVEPEINQVLRLHCFSPTGDEPSQQQILPLDQVLCQVTFNQDSTFALPGDNDTVPAAIDSARNYGLLSYIGANIWISGKKFGTVAFGSNQERSKPFEDIDREFIKMIASWMGTALERAATEKDLTIAKELAESASKAKSLFVANMSHEIRTPLTAILGFSEILQEQGKAGNSMNSAITSIIKNGKHLTQIINDVLDMSKIEAGQIEIEKLAVSPMQIMSEVESLIGMNAREA
ncbi:MAG: GAF domain-containing protein, partial [Gammaproteobacteria bacterium]|nr:GAF domain-containing protein [Gammaproteobacteria bacterium]